MTKPKLSSVVFATALLVILFVSLGTGVAAQSVKVEGLIKARNGDEFTLKTSHSQELIVRLTESTDVGQIRGMLHVRRKEMAMAALIPGLTVQVEGFYDPQHNLVAKSVRFKGNDLEQAQATEAGMHESKVEAQRQKEELEKQQTTLKHRQDQLTDQQEQLEHQQKIAANKAAIDAAIVRFGQLEDYYILDEVTIYFGNGKVEVDPKYKPQLLAMAEKAKTINGYLIEVKGYASSVGSVGLNQQLSEDRADNVTNILVQQGHVPLTRMLAPGAMGESHQVGNDKTAEGQAENRRVVVRFLQNKATAGV